MKSIVGLAEFALRRSGSWLRANIDALPDFPRPHEKFGRFSTAEIEAWVKRQFPRSTVRMKPGTT
jgi:hypothetical protein